MKKITIGLVVCWALLQAARADEAWLTDLAKAQAKAKAESKMVLMDFNGSDWCPPCKLLRKNVLSSPEFLEYATKNLVLVDVDFPRGKTQSEQLKKANQELAQKFHIEGFPSIVVLSSDGKELRKDVGYDGQDAKDFIAKLNKLKNKS
ncbi:MAG TPA: thioredoxin family protein [Candidatus Binatia bacterium]|jgi:thioredoxin-related protein|nr:thioredoxin family protein [Candidatus Binatia bacterium]